MHATPPPHNLTPDMLGHVVEYRPNGEDSDIWGTLVEVNGDWATIAEPPDRTGFRLKTPVLARFVVVDPT